MMAKAKSLSKRHLFPGDRHERADRAHIRSLDGRRGSELNVEAVDVMFVPGQPRSRKVFLRSADGRITGFVDRREGRDIPWKKVR